jgi:hypothetical protein
MVSLIFGPGLLGTSIIEVAPGAGKRDRRQSPLDRRSGHLPRRNDPKRTVHSLRNAVTGSMRPARRAGM